MEVGIKTGKIYKFQPLNELEKKHYKGLMLNFLDLCGCCKYIEYTISMPVSKLSIKDLEYIVRLFACDSSFIFEAGKAFQNYFSSHCPEEDFSVINLVHSRFQSLFNLEEVKVEVLDSIDKKLCDYLEKIS